MGGGLRQCRDERDGGRPAADDHDPLPGKIEALGPELRVHQRPGVVPDALEVGQVAVVVPVVPATSEDEARREMEDLVRVGPLRRDVPARLGRRPVCRDDPVVEADMGVDAGLGGGVLDVLEDGVPVRNGPLAPPGPERVAQRVHVGVGANARVAEQIPRPSDGVASFEDGVGGPGTLRLEIVRGTDTRQPGTDDQDVEVHRLRLRSSCAIRQLRSAFRPVCRAPPPEGSARQACTDSFLSPVVRLHAGGGDAPPMAMGVAAGVPSRSGVESDPTFRDPDVNVKLLVMRTATLTNGNGRAQTEDDSRYRWIALSTVTLGTLMVFINQSIVLISLPDIFRGIDLNPLTPGNTGYMLWMLMGFMVVLAVLVVTLGRVGDMFGRVKIFNLGFAVFTAFSVLLAATWLTGTGGAIWLITMRIGQGVGGAMLFANSSAIITDAFPAHKRGLGLGINNVAAIAGSFIGLVLGGLLAPVEWHLVFLISVPFGVLGTAWRVRQARGSRDPHAGEDRLAGQHNLRRRPDPHPGRDHLWPPALRRAHDGVDQPRGDGGDLRGHG